MRRTGFVRACALVLALTTTATGCASAAAPRPAVVHASGSRHTGSVELSAKGRAEVGAHAHGAKKTRHGKAVAALFIVGAILIVGAVILDVLLLPATVPCHEEFCCSRTIVHHCW